MKANCLKKSVTLLSVHHSFIKSFFVFLVGSIFIFSACKSKKIKLDTTTEGSIAISVDEFYKAAMEEQIRVFESRNPKAHIHASYKPEADCIADLLKDTTRLIFITHPLTTADKAEFEAKKLPITREMPMARDAIAFIVAKSAKVNYTQTEFEKILTGINQEQQMVFDNDNSSALRYVKDSILKGKPLAKNNFAVKNVEELVTHVAGNPASIGVVGVGVVNNLEDAATQSLLQKVNVVGILPFNDSFERYRQPIFQYIANLEYPYRRELFFISKETHIGLGTGFANYLAKDGQLLFEKFGYFALNNEVHNKQIRINSKNISIQKK